jgi:hypothetical protein
VAIYNFELRRQLLSLGSRPGPGRCLLPTAIILIVAVVPFAIRDRLSWERKK